mmetsp:Transcript_43205/g.104263  ORF Transcript_43205/g.104263 Transcript_43205/m.104263 type:complete len:268 (-) Transcript_43205:1189-1992(-)
MHDYKRQQIQLLFSILAAATTSTSTKQDNHCHNANNSGNDGMEYKTDSAKSDVGQGALPPTQRERVQYKPPCNPAAGCSTSTQILAPFNRLMHSHYDSAFRGASNNNRWCESEVVCPVHKCTTWTERKTLICSLLPSSQGSNCVGQDFPAAEGLRVADLHSRPPMHTVAIETVSTIHDQRYHLIIPVCNTQGRVTSNTKHQPGPAVQGKKSVAAIGRHYQKPATNVQEIKLLQSTWKPGDRHSAFNPARLYRYHVQSHNIAICCPNR